MVHVDVDGDATTFNSSSADLDLPDGATVLWAGLYWGATSTDAARGQVRLTTPAAGETITDPDGVDDLGSPYQGVAVVTDQVVAGGNGTYTVANVQADTGFGRHAGWALLVAYRDPAQRTRNLTVFDGFQSVVSGAPVVVPVSGFETPPVGVVNTRVGVVTYEGDLGTTGDQILLDTTVLSDANNPANNPLNSTISNLAETVTAKDPDHANQLGFDMDRLELVDVIDNAVTSANFTFSSTGDVYYPGALTVATDLYAPRLVLDKQQVDTDGGDLRQGDRLDYTVGVVNDGDDPAVGALLFDPIPEGTTYVGGSLTLNGVAQTDALDGDDAEFRSETTTATFALGDLVIDETATVGLSVTVDAGIADGAGITNEATAAYESTSGLVLSGSSNVVAAAATVASDLSLTASATPCWCRPARP